MDTNSDHHEYCTGGFDPEDIVISGMSGRFPECDSVGELRDSLFNKRDLILFSKTRYEKGDMGSMFDSCGLVKNLDKFDANFFGSSSGVANVTDPASRIHMEVSYEAIADAGYDPLDLRGMHIAVYNATIAEDALKINAMEDSFVNLGAIRTMTPNRTTYAFDFTGPSFTVDSACSSSSVAMWNAVACMKAGYFDYAIVSGCHLNLHPHTQRGYFRGGIASPTGNSRPFDASSDGMIRTEAIVAVFIQKARNARRIYATIPSAKCYSAGLVSEGISVPCDPKLTEIILDTLEESKVDPNEIEYVEAHGTGTIVGDRKEISALYEAFCNKRQRRKPLLVGSIKSNIGHTEASSGLCGMVKSMLIFENDAIPPNIKYEKPNSGAQALIDGSVVVVTEKTPFSGDYIPVNSLGFGGTLAEILLKKNPKTYKDKDEALDIPRLVLFPATSEEAITTVFEYIQNTTDLKNEFFSLLSKLSFGDPQFKPFRGYALFQKGKKYDSEIKSLTNHKRQTWFVMTGMGCQWPGMGLQLMKFDVFAKSMRKSAETLKPFGIDLFEFLRADKDYFQRDRSITPSFVGICSIQIALIDLLKHIGINPDGMVGHSTGELLCAYADGCCTAEQTILSAYYRGYSVESSDLPKGGMAAVGVSWSQAKKLCPEGIFPACDNADDSVTISGLKGTLEKFAEKLKQDNIFVRLVNSHGFSFHCEHVHGAAPALKAALSKIITNPKPRSERWVSSSYSESEWDDPCCKIANADYFVHNLMSSVHFREALKRIPSDAYVIEIGPHFLLQSILKRAIGSKASYYGIMKRNEEDNVKFFMESIGKMYLDGLNPKIELFYPPVQFPVPRGTPMISDIIKWNHTQSFHVPKYHPETTEFHREFNFAKDDAYVMDHRIDGKSLFPATGYIYLAWEALAGKLQKSFQEVSVVIENFKIYRPVIISTQNRSMFYVNILDSCGKFEIMEGKSAVASGQVYECKNMQFQEGPPEYTSNDMSVSGKDLYSELKRAGYEYGPCFQNLVEASIDGNGGLVQWQGNWIPFLDSLLLFFGILSNNDGFNLPTGALSFKIDPTVMKNAADGKQNHMPVKYNPNTNVCRSVGVEITKLMLSPAPRRGTDDNSTLEKYVFVPYISNYTPTQESSLQISKYFCACNEFMNKVGNKVGKKDVKQFLFLVDKKEEFSIDEYLDGMPDDHQLLKILKSAIDDPKLLTDKKKDLFQTYTRYAGRDMLNNALINEDTLRTAIDTILENSFRKLNVIELNFNSPVILFHASEIIQKYSPGKFKNSILIAQNVGNITQDQLDAQKIQKLPETSLEEISKQKAQDLAISSFVIGSLSELQNLIRTLTSVVKSNGFVLLLYKEKANSAELFLSSVCGEELQVHSQAVLEKVLQNENLVILSKTSDPFGRSLYLLRAPSLESPQKVLQVSDSNYDWVNKVKEELYEKEGGKVWLLAQDSPINGIIGMVNCLKQEPGGERIRCIFISQKKQDKAIPSFSLENPFYTHLINKNLVINVWKDGSWGTYRHILITDTKVPRPVEHSYVNCQKYGDLSSFKWIESSVKYVDRQDKDLVHVYYSALNFRDVMLATGKLSIGTSKHLGQGNSVLGLEFSGRLDGSSKRVCGFTAARAMATSILAESMYCLEVPDNWTLEDAATVPVVYATCYYALILRAYLRKGESILIHSGTGGVGQAAIRIALSLNCEVYTTVGNDEKKKYLIEKFPQIKEENIGCSRNISFEKMIMERTKGKGVHVVLNSLADDKFTASMRCVAKSGRFVEIGKYDLSLDREIGLKMFLENISFVAVFLDQLFEKNSQTVEDINEIMNLIKDGIRTGVVQPLDRTVFGRDSVEEAFRYMAKGVHVGKVLLKIRDEEPEKRSVPKCLTLPAIPETQFYSHKVYIIIGGLGGFGIEVTKWLIQRGARNIILTSRYGARTPYHHFCIKRWKNEGVNIQVSTLNVGIKSEAEKLLQEANRVGPVGAIINSALVLKDAFMDSQTTENYKEVCLPKATATKNLDELSRKLCPSLDYFICFSSISCGRGNAGQTNYGYANSVMERICEERRRAGLHGLSIQWGIIGEVGVVHRNMGDDAMIAGIMSQGVQSCLTSLDAFCQQDYPVVTSYVTAEMSKKSVHGDTLAQIVKLLGIDVQVGSSRKLGEMGIDSIMGVEIKELIESYTEVTVTIQEVQEMRFDDIKSLFEKSDSDKSPSQSTGLMTTTTLQLPPCLLHKDPLIAFNKDAPGDSIFIVNTGDTDVTHFNILAQTLQRPLYVLVWSKDSLFTDIQSLASWYLKLIHTTVTSPFHIIGHGLGGKVAFEMALQSENLGMKLKTLTLLSGMDDLIKVLNKENTEVNGEEVEALCKFLEQFSTGDAAPRLKDELMKVGSDLEQRIKVVLHYITSSSVQTVNKNEVSEAITNFIKKYKIIESYIPQTKLAKGINIIENSSKLLANDVTFIKELFTEICSGKITIHRTFYPSQLSNKEDAEKLTEVLKTIIQ